MKTCSNISIPARIAGVVCSGMILVGCSSSSSTTPDTSNNASQLNDEAVGADSSSLGAAVTRLSTVMVDRSETVLRNLNAQIASAGVPEALSDCISATAFPVLEYFCGSEGEGVRLTEFGYPIHEFQFSESAACEAALVNANETTDCVLEVAEAELAENWFVRYRFIPEQEAPGVTTIQVSKGFFSSINDPSFANDICVVTLLGTEIVSYNDVVYCNSMMREVADIAANN